MEKVNKIIQQFLKGLIHGYRLIVSPVAGCRCRFIPTCSQFALEAIHQHHWFKGCLLTLRRLLRCHPLCAGGYDPVPTKK